MPKALKVILAIVGIFTLICILTAAIGVPVAKRWFSGVVADTATRIRDGRTFGAGRDGTACIEEGLHRVAPCAPTSVGCQYDAQVFTQACLEVAQDVPALCTGVPEVTDIRGTIAWRGARCASLGHANDQHCLNFIQVLQQHCVHRLFRQQQQQPVQLPITGAPAPPVPSPPSQQL